MTPVQIQTCPSEEALRQWVAGLADDSTTETFAEHVTACPHCIENIRHLALDDRLLGLLRLTPAPFADEERAAVHQLIESCCQWKLGQADTHVALPFDELETMEMQRRSTEQFEVARSELRTVLSAAQTARELGRLGSFLVLRILGVGGMGIVVAAEDPQLGRNVAIKVMRPLLVTNEAARQRFLREARAMASLDHDHIVSVYQVGQERGVPFFAMPILRGESLQSRLARQHRLSTSEVIQIGTETAAGLAAAHARGLIHRDIKPSNIWLETCQTEEGVDSLPQRMVDGSGDCRQRVKILDFGLVRVASESLDLTTTGYIAGTPAYMSPEQARGEAIDERTDLFSLGCILFEACTGERPFSGGNPTAILLALTNEPLRRVLELNSALPPQLALLIERLLEKDPAWRIQTAAQVVADLTALKSGAPADTGNRLVLPVEESLLPTGPPVNSGRRFGRKLLLASVASVALSILAAVAVLVVPRTEPEESQLANTADARRDQAVSKTPRHAVAPFEAAAAQAYQEAWAEHLGVKVAYENSIRMELRLIPPGEFRMGSTDEEIRERLSTAKTEQEKVLIRTEGPQRTVTLSRPFYCATTEVTRAQFREFIVATGHKTEAETNGRGSVVQVDGGYQFSPKYIWSGDPGTPTDDHPVTCVSWNDATAFCDWLTRKESVSYDLPTEAQWEFACRAGCAGQWSLGDGDGNDVQRLQQFAWLDELGGSQPVGQKLANAFGLFDMHGNVWEWCADWFAPDYYASGPSVDPRGGANDSRIVLRVLRGGSFNFPASRARSAHRNYDAATAPAFNRGFRVVVVGDLTLSRSAARASPPNSSRRDYKAVTSTRTTRSSGRTVNCQGGTPRDS